MRFSILKLFSYNIYQSLTVLYVPFPYTITTYYNKLILWFTIYCLNVRFTCYHLLMVTQLLLCLVIKITKWTSQVQSSIHSTHVYHTTCVLYPLLLHRTLRFMVKRKVHSLPSPAKRTSWIASICNNVVSGSNQNNISSASSSLRNRLTLRHTSLRIKFPCSFLRLKNLIHNSKSLI